MLQNSKHQTVVEREAKEILKTAKRQRQLVDEACQHQGQHKSKINKKLTPKGACSLYIISL